MKNQTTNSAIILIISLALTLSVQVIAWGQNEKPKIDVWDFGAEQLDENNYNNCLTVDIINNWYPESITLGSSGNTLPSFTSGILSWTGGGNDRLRTSNTAITRYDENISGAKDYSGRIYVNSAANASRYLSFTLNENDIITLFTKTDAGGNIVFQNQEVPELQSDEIEVGTDLTELIFVAKQAGEFRVFDKQGKPSYYRVYRKSASYATVSGTINRENATDIPENYSIQFKNEAGKTWQTTPEENNSYSIDIPIGNTYEISLINANGYIVSSESTVAVLNKTLQFDITILKVELFTLSGSISGLNEQIINLKLDYSADINQHKIFKPSPVINYETATYSVQLEANCEYTISAQGVNDYYISENTISIEAIDTNADIQFEAKALYAVSILAEGLNTEQLQKLKLTFINNNDGYQYQFDRIEEIALRNGSYNVEYERLDEFAVKMGLTSNLNIDNTATSKKLSFENINTWTFDDKIIADGTNAYNGLHFTKQVSNEMAKGHLVAKPGTTIQVPVNQGDKIEVSYYYTASFTIEDSEPFFTESKSTSTNEYAYYTYTGTKAGYITITIGDKASSTYITEISIDNSIQYLALIEVGKNKTYPSVNDALNAISKMVRNNNERVTIMIDPGNYEEMLLVNENNITLKNAAAVPGIGLKNQGVDIDENAVRITSYYGHGYNYYSMKNNQKWDAEVLRVNRENGSSTYQNTGAGTNNGSYWNATVVINAKGFIAENIIFENSFNQYISQKESNDVVLTWESGSKGTRPTNYGNTNVQQRNFVERAAALAITKQGDKVILNDCRVVGRQDSFYGAEGARVVVYKGAMMGAVDYLFGGMTAVFYKSSLIMNTSDDSNDRSYITAAQQNNSRGFLMYQCHIESAEPGIESASEYKSKPGYFGRPWQATTSEVVFYSTTIGTSNALGYEGKSLIDPIGWVNSLGGESAGMCEFNSIEISGSDNSSRRAKWSTLLNEAKLSDGTAITPYLFTKGNDEWDPITALIANDNETGYKLLKQNLPAKLHVKGNQILLSNIYSDTLVKVFSINGTMVKSFKINTDSTFEMNRGIWIVSMNSIKGTKAVKVVTQ